MQPREQVVLVHQVVQRDQAEQVEHPQVVVHLHLVVLVVKMQPRERAVQMALVEQVQLQGPMAQMVHRARVERVVLPQLVDLVELVELPLQVDLRAQVELEEQVVQAVLAVPMDLVVQVQLVVVREHRQQADLAVLAEREVRVVHRDLVVQVVQVEVRDQAVQAVQAGQVV